MAVRLRSRRQVNSPPNLLRREIKQLLGQARQTCIGAGYPDEDITLGVYAFTVFLDETILQSDRNALAEWARQPLQEELFEGSTGGELFFEYLDGLLKRPDTHHTADLLEVFQTCLLLGYRGRYRHVENDAIPRLLEAVASKMRRTRGEIRSLSPLWRLPEHEQVPNKLNKDPFLPRLGLGLGVALFLMLVLLIVFKISKRAGESEIEREARVVESTYARDQLEAN